MTLISHESRPRLARGCRLRQQTGGDSVLLMPERALKINGTGLRILQLSDGRTVDEILTALASEFPAQSPANLEAGAMQFLERLHEKRAIDFD
jgi:pyrroloquinoline quinone biosynthesis protein D